MSERMTKGFTLIELVMVIVILGIIAVVAMPRFFNRNTFDARGFHDEVKAVVRYGHKVAVAQRRDVSVNITASQICLTYTAGGNVLNPANGQAFCKTAPSGVTLSVVNFSFSPLGKPSVANAMTIGVTGDGITRNITVERETGYVH